jgi:hypothetical protein
METSYSQLQVEVARLRRELEERNATLTSTLAENTVFVAGTVLSAQIARAILAQDCGTGPDRNSTAGSSAIGRFVAMRIELRT